MKRIHIFLFLLVTCFILNGCGTQNPSDSGPEAKDHTTATGNAILTESTITWFNTEYFNSGDGVNMRNMLLSSQYSTIVLELRFRLKSNFQDLGSSILGRMPVIVNRTLELQDISASRNFSSRTNMRNR